MRDYLQRRKERQKPIWPARIKAQEHNQSGKRKKSPARMVSCTVTSSRKCTGLNGIAQGESVQVRHVRCKKSGERVGVAAVQEFLQSIRPAMDGLLPVFVQGGITDEDHLDAFARLPEAQQAQFLRKDLGLNALHVRNVRLAILDWTKY